jgi:hypothetical protein
MTMPTAWPELDLDSIEKLREEELDEARVIQSGMLPTQPLRVGGITFSHEFQPAASSVAITWILSCSPTA